MRQAVSPARRRRLAFLVPCVVGVACSDSSSPPSPTSVTAVTTTTATAIVGSAVSANPSVKVTDGKGSAVAGTVVQFTVVSGGGSIERSSATTDASGSASAGKWTLGTTAGSNILEATVAGLSAVRFTATGTAGAAATIAATAGDNQTAAVGTTLPNAPAVVVKDQYANAVAGATVTFSLVSGGGALTGASATTGADGIARLGGWTLGIATGAQQIRATTSTLSTTLSATAMVPSGCTAINYALGATLSSAWDADDCANASYSGRRYDRLQFTTTSQQQIDAQVDAAAGRALLLRNAATGHYVGLQPGTAFSPPSQSPMHLKYILAPGSWVFEPHAPDAATLGGYTLTTTMGTKVDCDYIVFASTNVQFTDDVNSNSCVGPTGGKEQWINLQLKTGTKVRITLSGSEFVPILVLRDDRLGPASPTLVAKIGTTVGETLVIDWTATFDTWHEVIVAPKTAVLGRYTLKIEELP
jgi:hypothetical protein